MIPTVALIAALASPVQAEVDPYGPSTWLGPRFGGGGIVGGTAAWVLDGGTIIDLGLSTRPGIEDLDLYMNLMASAGITWELGGQRSRHGVFLGGGSCIPGLPYYDSQLAIAYHHRLARSSGSFAWQFRTGAGVLPYGSIESHSLGVRPMVFLSTSLLFRVGGRS
jgi:hypothetical protein